MQKRRALSWLLLLCFICSAVSLPVQATDYKTIDQLGIDPWGDMEKLPGTVYHQKPDTVIFPTEDIAELPEGGEVVPDFVPFALPQGSYSLVGDGSTSTYYQFYVGDSASVSVNGKTTFDFSKGFNPLKSSPGTSSNGYNARVWKGHYWDLSSEVSYSASGNSKVYLNGTFGFYPYITYDNSSGVSSSASFTEGLFTIQLMVNGKLVGSSVSGTRLRLSNYELDLSKLGNIYSIGARLSIVQGDTISNGSTIKDATVTFSGAVVDRYDYAACYEFLKLFCRNLYYTYGCLYLFVPELHEDGAYHFHGLIQGDLPVVEAINPKTGDPLMVKGAQIYNIPIWKAGFSNASRVKSSKAISSYIAKYITKGFSCPKGCHRYLASTRKLLRSTEEKVIMSQEEFGEIFNQARYQKRIAGPYGDFLLCED